MASPEIDALTQALSRLPGLGPRSARRAVLHLLKKRESALEPLLRALDAVNDRLVTCGLCGNVDTVSCAEVDALIAIREGDFNDAVKYIEDFIVVVTADCITVIGHIVPHIWAQIFIFHHANNIRHRRMLATLPACNRDGSFRFNCHWQNSAFLILR